MHLKKITFNYRVEKVVDLKKRINRIASFLFVFLLNSLGSESKFNIPIII